MLSNRLFFRRMLGRAVKSRPHQSGRADEIRDPAIVEFDVSVDRLRERWREVVAAQPRVELLSEDGQQSDYVQRSARFRFPDIITVRFISVSPSQSTLAIYSRSVYGNGDFGVNRKRIEAWLKNLREGL